MLSKYLLLSSSNLYIPYSKDKNNHIVIVFNLVQIHSINIKIMGKDLKII